MLAISISSPHRHAAPSVQPGSNKRSNADIEPPHGESLIRPKIAAMHKSTSCQKFQLFSTFLPAVFKLLLTKADYHYVWDSGLETRATVPGPWRASVAYPPLRWGLSAVK
jgi:hypothetical protein